MNLPDLPQNKLPKPRSIYIDLGLIVLLAAGLGIFLWVMRPRTITLARLSPKGRVAAAIIDGVIIYGIQAKDDTQNLIAYNLDQKKLTTLVSFHDRNLFVTNLRKQPGANNFIIAAAPGGGNDTPLNGGSGDQQKIGWWDGNPNQASWKFLGSDINDAIWQEDGKSIIALIRGKGNDVDTQTVVEINPGSGQRTSIVDIPGLALANLQRTGNTLYLVSEPTGIGRSEIRDRIDLVRKTVQQVNEPTTMTTGLVSPDGRYIGGQSINPGADLIWAETADATTTLSLPATDATAPIWSARNELIGISKNGDIWTSLGQKRLEIVGHIASGNLPANASAIGWDKSSLILTSDNGLSRLDLRGVI